MHLGIVRHLVEDVRPGLLSKVATVVEAYAIRDDIGLDNQVLHGRVLIVSAQQLELDTLFFKGERCILAILKGVSDCCGV